MDAHRRELARRIFVIATEMLEDAHEAAIAGQSPQLSIRPCLQLAQDLREAGCDLMALAEAVICIARPKRRKADIRSRVPHGKKRRSPQ